MNTGLIKRIADHKQWIKKLLPIGMLRSMKMRYLERMIRNYKKESVDRARLLAKEAGVNLIGDIRAEIGLGQSMRLLANELELSKYPFGIYDFQLGGHLRREDHSWDCRMREDCPYRMNLFHVNPQEVGMAYLYLDKEIWRDRYNIAFWLWELEEFPEEYIETIKFFDEIWTPSEFASSSIRKVTDKPVYTIPYYVLATADEKFDRAYFELPEDKFLYLIMYDTNSTMARKNPVGALEAYKRAFPQEEKEVGLVIKVNNATEEDLRIIREQIGEERNVYFITRTLDKIQVNSLIKTVDVFVSLHCAEGFGLVMAEAMLLGTVCVATDWSSNTEFMNREVACMVSYHKAEIESTAGNYKKGCMWAKADVEEAAGYLRKLYEDRAYYEQLAATAKRKAEECLGKDRIVSLLEQRLGDILGESCAK
ncbi:MAG: glycosyltransferase [Clostridiales bacterium]|nr:glycosyltransferase [Clostridiales bacterium]